MSNESLLLQQTDRQNQLIDVLLKENAYLKRALTALLPGGNGLSQTELTFLKAIAGNNEIENSCHQVMEGNNATNNSNHDVMVGNN